MTYFSSESIESHVILLPYTDLGPVAVVARVLTHGKVPTPESWLAS